MDVLADTLLHSKDTFYVVAESAYGYELVKQLLQQNEFTKKNVCEIIKQVTSAVDYLHIYDIVHGGA